jgi:site-specific DNA recombinase
VLRLAFLAPQVTDQIVSGTQSADLTAQKLSRLLELPHAWSEQQALLDA